MRWRRDPTKRADDSTLRLLVQRLNDNPLQNGNHLLRPIDGYQITIEAIKPHRENHRFNVILTTGERHVATILVDTERGVIKTSRQARRLPRSA